MGGGDAAREA